MSFVALTNFITITNPNGSVQNIPDKFQNGKQPSISGHDYLSFIYQGATRNRTGDNMTSSLILANSELSMNYAQQMVLNKYHVKVETCLMTKDFEKLLDNNNDPRILTSETWLASSMSYDPETIELILSSAIDAVGAQCPTKVLTKDLCGSLPVTGSLQNR
jgi:phage-related protein